MAFLRKVRRDLKVKVKEEKHYPQQMWIPQAT
jgi:hypothetical protein